MHILVECIEPESLPLVQSITVDLLIPFRLFILNDIRFNSPGNMRNSILMRIEEGVDPPPEASLVMELDIYDPGAGDPWMFRVKRMGSRVLTDLVRPNVRSRVAEGHDIPSGSRLELILQDTRRVLITLQMESDQMRRTEAIGAGAVRHKAPDSMSATWFLYNGVMRLLAINSTIIKDKIILYLRKWGIHPTIFLTLGSIGLVLGMAGYLAWNRHQAASEAEAKAEELADVAAKTEQAKIDAVSAEQRCLAEQAQLARRLAEKDQEKLAFAKLALQFTSSQTVAIDVGGKELLNDDLKKFNLDFQSKVMKQVVAKMEMVDTSVEDMQFCLDLEKAMGFDLPKYPLLWHPNPDMVCPTDYSSVDQGIDRLGRWGLSVRVARLFNAQTISDTTEEGDNEAEGDPRKSPRWAVNVMASGLREIQTLILTADTGSQVVIAPSQIHLWSLALWDAFNRMPSPANGVMDKPLEYCIEEFIGFMTDNQNSPKAGAPIFPDLTLVSSGVYKINITPSPGCPWPTGAFQKGAENAIQAASNYAFYIQETKSSEDAATSDQQ